MWSGHQKPQVQPEAGPAEPGTGFNYFRVRNVRFVNTPDAFLLFVFISCCRGCCCFSQALNKGRAASSLSLFGKAKLEKPLGEANHENNVITQDPRSGCWVLPRRLLIASSTPCVAGGNDNFSGMVGVQLGIKMDGHPSVTFPCRPKDNPVSLAG